MLLATATLFFHHHTTLTASVQDNSCLRVYSAAVFVKAVWVDRQCFPEYEAGSSDSHTKIDPMYPYGLILAEWRKTTQKERPWSQTIKYELIYLQRFYLLLLSLKCLSE